MTDTNNKPTYEELLAERDQLQRELERTREERNDARRDRDSNLTNGQAWKKQAEALTSQVDAERRRYEAALTESAELRGYIRRVNELDPKRVRRKDEHRNALDRFAR